MDDVWNPPAIIPATGGYQKSGDWRIPLPSGLCPPGSQDSTHPGAMCILNTPVTYLAPPFFDKNDRLGVMPRNAAAFNPSDYKWGCDVYGHCSQQRFFDNFYSTPSEGATLPAGQGGRCFTVMSQRQHNGNSHFYEATTICEPLQGLIRSNSTTILPDNLLRSDGRGGNPVRTDGR